MSNWKFTFPAEMGWAHETIIAGDWLEWNRAGFLSKLEPGVKMSEEDVTTLYEWVYVTFDEEGNGTVAHTGGFLWAFNDEDAKTKVAFSLAKDSNVEKLDGEILVQTWER